MAVKRYMITSRQGFVAVALVCTLTAPSLVLSWRCHSAQQNSAPVERWPWRLSLSSKLDLKLVTETDAQHSALACRGHWHKTEFALRDVALPHPNILFLAFSKTLHIH